MNELRAASEWLFATLTEDATVASLVSARVYEGQAPQGAAFPLLVFAFVAGQDRNAYDGSDRLAARPLYLLKAVCQGGSFENADIIAAAVDEALKNASGTRIIASVEYRLSCLGREQPLRLLEAAPGGKQHRTVGGTYRLWCSAVP